MSVLLVDDHPVFRRGLLAPLLMEGLPNDTIAGCWASRRRRLPTCVSPVLLKLGAETRMEAAVPLRG